MSGCINVEDSLVYLLAKCCVNLQSFALSQCTTLSSISLNIIPKFCTNLQASYFPFSFKNNNNLKLKN